jgi:hypothetical protein
MHIVSQINKTTVTHSEYVILFFHDNNGNANASRSLTCAGASCESSGLLQAFYLRGPFSIPGDCVWTCGGKAAMGQCFLSMYRVIKKCLCTWRLQHRNLQVMFKVFPASLQPVSKHSAQCDWHPNTRARATLDSH